MARLEHVGIAVDDPDAVRDLYETLLGVLPYKSESVPKQGVRTHFLNAGSAKLELLEALSEDSPIATYLRKRGEGIHHLAFDVDDVDATFQRVKEAGFEPLSNAPSSGADGKRIFFLHPKQTHGVLVEFCSSVPRPWTPRMVEFEGEQLAVYEAGSPDASPLLLLHGAAGCTQLETAPLMRLLEPSFRVLAVDFSGHGRSTSVPNDAPFTPELFARNARAALDATGVDVADVFGFSMGGNMALQFARQFPDRVGRLVLHSANVDWNDDLAQQMTARLDADGIEAHRPNLARQLDEAHRDWTGLFAKMRAFVDDLPARTPEMKARAEAVSHPALVTTLDRDDLFSVDAALTLHRLLVNGRLAVFPGIRHALPLAPLGVMADTMTDFLTS